MSCGLAMARRMRSPSLTFSICICTTAGGASCSSDGTCGEEDSRR